MRIMNNISIGDKVTLIDDGHSDYCGYMDGDILTVIEINPLDDFKYVCGDGVKHNCRFKESEIEKHN